jgi:hypothetical protein
MSDMLDISHGDNSYSRRNFQLLFVWWVNSSLPQRYGLNGVFFFSGTSICAARLWVGLWQLGARWIFHSITPTLQTGTARVFVQRPPDCAEDAVPIVGSTGNGMFR